MLGKQIHEISSKVKKNHVKAQAPKAGLTVPNGTKITITVSDGPKSGEEAGEEAKPRLAPGARGPAYSVE